MYCLCVRKWQNYVFNADRKNPPVTSLRRGANEPFPGGCRLEEFSAVVASLRLDCAVAASYRLSREKANLLIQEGLVMLMRRFINRPDW